MDAGLKNNQAEQVLPVLQDKDSFFDKEALESTWTFAWTATAQPHGGNPNEHTLKFNVNKVGYGNYFFLQEARLKLGVRLVDKDGKGPVAANTTVAPINGVAQSLFSDLRLF